jgi:nitroimidazol reductase NimA-like FMN-containing flavoprotein (pyridoxamine 5'-phosphate oxidase superfamily)
MIVHELTRDECDQVLSRRHVARLACARQNQPYVVPVSLAFDRVDRALIGFATVGQKVEWMRDNPKVCVEVDEIADDIHWTTVVVVGSYEEIDPADATRMARVQALLQPRDSWWLPATGKPSSGAEHASHVFYRIVIRSVTGRRTSMARQ